jgi:hypothetical protein
VLHVAEEQGAAEEAHGGQESGALPGGAQVPVDDSYGGGTGQAAGGAGRWPPLSQGDASSAAAQDPVPEVCEESMEEGGGEPAPL